MSQRFVKGLTNNHLTWVMVDATDFATPESAASAATTITIYGKLRGATGVNIVGATGTGSLTNDIQHVGASATGIYTIALAKADLSDASAAWYDQYIITLSCTGCARQTLVVDGGIVESQLLALSDAVSNVQSYLIVMSGMLSDTHSAAILGASHASEAQSNAILAASRILLVQSRLSDFQSAVYASDISSIVAAVAQVNSRVLLTQSYASDAASYALLTQSRLSDFMSAIHPSDISNILSALTIIDSRVLLTQSAASNAYSAAVAISDQVSNVLSALVVIDDFLDGEIAQINSRVLLIQSDASNTYSLLNTAHAEPTGVPAADATLANKIGYMFAALRNKITVTSSKMQFFDDSDAALWEKDLSDNGTTYTETEGNAP